MNRCVSCLSKYVGAKTSYEIEVNDLLRYVSVALCMDCWESWADENIDLVSQYHKLEKADKKNRKLAKNKDTAK